MLYIIQGISGDQQEEDLANAYRRLGTLYKQNALLDSAVDAYITSISFAEKANYKQSIASTQNQLGATYHEMNDTSNAILYFRSALHSYRVAENNNGVADAANNLAQVYFEKGDLEQALKLCDTSMDYRRKVADTPYIADNYQLLASINLAQGKKETALSYIRKAVQLYRHNDDVDGLIPGLLMMGKIRQELNQTDDAMSAYREAYDLASYHLELRAAATLGLSETFGKQQDSQSHYLREYIRYADTLHNKQMLKKAMELAARYETNKKDLEIMHQQQLSNDRLLLIVVLVIVVALLLFLIIVINRNFVQKRKVELKDNELKNMNAMLRGQDTERERIARELHDRVGSMLSTVKLHFSVLEERVSDSRKEYGASYEMALTLLDETYEEVRRISHDLDAGVLRQFGFVTAVMQLIAAIEATNKLHVFFLDNNLSPYLYKPYEADLYRITQELLTNTMKYAAATEVSIQLSVSGDMIIYSYEDDGCGFDKEILRQSKGIGYQNIDVRVLKLNGKWHLDTSPGYGLNLIIELPAYGNDPHRHS